MWVLTVLQAGPRHPARLLDDIRAIDGPMGHGTLFAALARLERLALVHSSVAEGDRRAYQLSALGAAASESVAALRRAVGR
jgi:DNA-binding PadR family transcriptional regulator